MTLAEYQTLKGVTVADSDVNRINGIIRQCETLLGTMLGYSLSRQKKWNELGKVQYNNLVPFPSLPMSQDVLNTLGTPDDQVGNIQLFNFDELNKHFRINPANEIYRAKIVLPINSNEFVTITDLQNATPYLNSSGHVIAITPYYTWFAWTWWNLLLWTTKNSLMLAVDADYLDLCNVNKYPDIAWLLVDMIDYYSDPAYSLLGNILSESVDTHKYSRGLTASATISNSAPEVQPGAKAIIDKYAGPAGYKKLVA